MATQPPRNQKGGRRPPLPAPPRGDPGRGCDRPLPGGPRRWAGTAVKLERPAARVDRIGGVRPESWLLRGPWPACGTRPATGSRVAPSGRRLATSTRSSSSPGRSTRDACTRPTHDSS